eukprot:Tamp_34525.p1 GENE.Tamp_34525~~Tamp_34525.p1  ORF type:complete len:178 (+),score=0.47 Tamp_34525:1-534(+)
MGSFTEFPRGYHYRNHLRAQTVVYRRYKHDISTDIKIRTWGRGCHLRAQKQRFQWARSLSFQLCHRSTDTAIQSRRYKHDISTDIKIRTWGRGCHLRAQKQRFQWARSLSFRGDIIIGIICVLRPWFDCIDRHAYLLDRCSASPCVLPMDELGKVVIKVVIRWTRKYIMFYTCISFD